jgi:hypothetical protein
MDLIILLTDVAQYVIKAVKMLTRRQVPKSATLCDRWGEVSFQAVWNWQSVCPMVLCNPNLSLSLRDIRGGGYYLEYNMIFPGVISSYIWSSRFEFQIKIAFCAPQPAYSFMKRKSEVNGVLM